MVPRVGKAGSSFKGAGLYYLHDKEAMTAERVAFTQTHNIPTDDAERAMEWMAWTHMHQGELKEAAGVKRTGGDCEKPVFHYSLAWHPDENPDEGHMLKCARETLSFLGLGKHEAVFVGHQDQEHPHVHVIANLVSPETGRTHEPYRSGQKLSEWAERYELQHGVYCEQRMINNAQRRRGEEVRYEEEKSITDKDQLQALYGQCDSFGAFQGALEHAGCHLARGNRRGVVIVDQDGKTHSLSRQLSKEQRAQLKDQLKEMDLSELPDAGEMQARIRQAQNERQHEAEQQAEQRQQDTQEGEGGQQEGQGAQEAFAQAQAPPEPPQAEEAPREEVQDHPDPPKYVFDLNALQNRQFEELSRFSSRHYAERGKLNDDLAHRYESPLHQQKERLAELEDSLRRDQGLRGFWRGLIGQSQQDRAELEQVREAVREMEGQIRASQEAYEQRRQSEYAEIQQRHDQERQSVIEQAQLAGYEPEVQSSHQQQQRPEQDGPSQSL